VHFALDWLPNGGIEPPTSELDVRRRAGRYRDQNKILNRAAGQSPTLQFIESLERPCMAFELRSPILIPGNQHPRADCANGNSRDQGAGIKGQRRRIHG
jgi:hypothetical protein